MEWHKNDGISLEWNWNDIKLLNDNKMIEWYEDDGMASEWLQWE